MTENLADDIDKETLVTLLKDKGKEIKTLEGKNKKLEERYVKIFRENKNLKQDKETLEKLLLTIFDQEQDKQRFTNVESGTYELAPLTDLWTVRQDEKLKLFNETLESHKNEKSELEKKVATLGEQVNKLRNEHNPQTEKMVESYKSHASDLEHANKKLTQEIKELNDIIETKNQEISSLGNAEYEIDSLKAELLMKELQIKNINEDQNMKSKMQENERKNEVLRLKHDLENAQERIKEHENEKERLRKAKVENLHSQTTQTASLHEPTSPEAQPLSADGSPAGTELNRKMSTRSDSELQNHIGENGQVNQEYLKNVILKLFCYIEGNNVKEAKALMNAISIIVKMTPEDREKIEDAKKGNSIWSNTVHFLKDTFAAKGEVNYYTHTMDQR